MKNVLLSALLSFFVMSLTTGCSMMGEGGSKCGSSHDGKCGADKSEKKCGANKDGKCGSDK
jgi:hypothetical protein